MRSLLFAFFVLLPQLVFAQAAQENLSELIPNIEKSIQDTKELFGNCQFELEMEMTVEVKDGENRLQRVRQKFFSREQTFYRFEETVLESSTNPDTVGTVTIFVVRPEGFAQLFKKTSEDRPVATNWGTGHSEGLSKLMVHPIVECSKRTGYFSIDNWLVNPGKHPLKNVTVKKVVETESSMGTVLEAIGSFEGADKNKTKGSFAISMLPQNYDVVSYEYKAGGSTEFGSLEYDNAQSFPLMLEMNTVDPTGAVMKVYQITDYTLEPAPMELFEIDSFKTDPSISKNRWFWRMIVLVVGVALLVIVVIMRRQEKS